MQNPAAKNGTFSSCPTISWPASLPRKPKHNKYDVCFPSQVSLQVTGHEIWSWCFRETNSILAVTLYGIRLLVQRHSVTIQLSVYFDFIWLDNNCNSTKGILQYEGTGMCYITYKLNHKCKCKVGADSDIFISLWNVSHGLYIIYTSFLRYLNGLSLMAQPGMV